MNNDKAPRRLGRLASIAVLCGAMLGCEDISSFIEGEAKWTFLVYLVADNDLEKYALGDLEEIASVGSRPSAQWIVQIDRAPNAIGVGDSVLNVDGFTSTRRFKVQPGFLEELDDLDETDTGQSDTLADFISWGINAYPAERTALILWDHGGGFWGFGWDYTDEDGFLDVSDIGVALSDGLSSTVRDKIDLIGFDACLQGSVEVAAELSDVGDVMVASSELEPGTGWAFGEIAEAVVAEPSMSAQTLADVIIDTYAASVSESWQDMITLSAVDLSKMEALSSSVEGLRDDIVTALEDPAKRAEVAALRAHVVDYGDDPDPQLAAGAVDLKHLAQLAADRSVSSDNARALISQLDSTLLATHIGPRHAGAGGLSVLFPLTEDIFIDGDFEAYDASRFGGLNDWLQAPRFFYDTDFTEQPMQEVDIGVEGGDVVVSSEVDPAAVEVYAVVGVTDQATGETLVVSANQLDTGEEEVIYVDDGGFVVFAAESSVQLPTFQSLDFESTSSSTCKVVSVPVFYQRDEAVDAQSGALHFRRCGEEQALLGFVATGQRLFGYAPLVDGAKLRARRLTFDDDGNGTWRALDLDLDAITVGDGSFDVRRDTTFGGINPTQRRALGFMVRGPNGKLRGRFKVRDGFGLR